MKGRKLFPWVVVAAGLLAYHNSFTGSFFQDDFGSILNNSSIHHLWPIWRCLLPLHQGGWTVEGRPLINLSLAINYALGGYNVWGYHALNLTVHILAGLTLLGIVRRTLLQPRLRGRFGAAANELALAIAVLWMVHPLQTESVTYVIQRAESIMGLFYLLTLYCFIRGSESRLVAKSTRDELRSRWWYSLSVTACALGMASKEVMVSAPLIVLVYDRVFVAGSFREMCRRRWPLYSALASTWILLGFILVTAGNFANAALNAQSMGHGWWQYLATQPGVILYYVRLSVWPTPLMLCHGWSIAKTWMSILPPAIVVVSLMAASAWAWRKNPAPLRAGPVWGFVGAWFFLILAPSSSFFPLHDLIYEHRMYLSLAAVVSLVVVGLYSLVGRLSLVVFAMAAIGLGFLTWQRNQDYQSEVAMQFRSMTKFPNDPASYYNLGVALGRAGRIQEALACYEQAVRLNPDYYEAHNDWGVALQNAGRVPEAIAHYEEAVRINPKLAEACNNLAVVLMREGKLPEAIERFEQALRINPVDATLHYNLGVTLQRQGKISEAIAHYEQTVRLNPDWAQVHNNLAAVLMQTGQVPEAIYHWKQAVHLNPDSAEAHYNLGIALEKEGRVQEAIEHYEQALRSRPDYAEAQKALARLRSAQ